MKKIFWLFKKEIKTLYKFIVLITIIITLFLSALFGVTNILIDYSKNFKTTLNEDLNGLEFEVANSNYSSLQTYCENAVVRAKLKNYTHTTKLECSNGNYFDTDQFEQKEEVTYLKSYNGVVLYSYEHFANKLKEQNINLEGSWHKGKNQIVLSDIVAEQLQAKIGDSIKILDNTFLLVGIFDFDLLNQIDYHGAYYYLSFDNEKVFDTMNVSMSESYDTYKLFNKLKGKGFEVTFFSMYAQYFENVRLMEMVLVIFAIIIFIGIMIVLYSFISIILMNRKNYICQLKLLGLKEKDIFAVYMSIIVLLLIVSVIFATFIGYFFNSYIMSLCVKLFDMKIKASLNFYLSPIIFVVTCLFAGLIYMFINKKLKNKMVAQLVKEQL